MRYAPDSGMVIYRSKPHATLKRNYQLMPAVTWLRLLMNHVPDKYEHLVRKYCDNPALFRQIHPSPRALQDALTIKTVRALPGIGGAKLGDKVVQSQNDSS